MSDALKLALTITAADLASGVLRRLRERITGTGEAARRVQKDYDRMVTSMSRGVKALAGAGYIAAKLRPGVAAAGALQGELIGVRSELSGANTDAAELARHMTEVRKTAFGVQAYTPFDIGQIVALEKELVKAGAEVQAVIGEKGAAAAAAALATYERMDPVLAGTALIGIGTPFKIAADGYAGLADQISRAASASTVGAAEIAESAKYAAGPLASLSRSSDEMLALVAVMAQVGVTGTMAGTSLKNFFIQAAKQRALKDANGNLKSTVEIIDALRRRTAGMGEARLTTFLTKIFGQEGLPVALALLNQGKGSFEQIVQSMHDAAPLTEKLNQQMTGFNRQMDSLGGTGKSTLAILFEPALAPLTALVEKTNEWVAALGKAALEHENIGKAVTYGGIGIAGALGVYGAAKIAQGGAAGLRVLAGLRGVGGAAAGIATGKAVEAATGVAPVFVTNWPAEGLLGAAAGGAAAGTAGRAGALARLAGRAGLVGAAGAAGYGAGTLLNDTLINGTAGGRAFGDKLGEGIARVLAWFGNEEARRAIAANEQAEPMRGEVVVRVRPERGAEARTDRPRSYSSALGLEVETEAGVRAGGAW